MDLSNNLLLGVERSNLQNTVNPSDVSTLINSQNNIYPSASQPVMSTIPFVPPHHNIQPVSSHPSMAITPFVHQPPVASQTSLPTGLPPQTGLPIGLPTGLPPQTGLPTGLPPQTGLPTGLPPQTGMPTGLPPQPNFKPSDVYVSPSEAAKKQDDSLNNITHFHLISKDVLGNDEVKYVRENQDNIKTQIVQFINDLDPNLSNVDVKILESMPWSGKRTIDEHIPNKRGSFITSQAHEENPNFKEAIIPDEKSFPQNNEQYNFVAKKSKKKSNNNNNKKSKKNKFMVGGGSGDIFTGLDATDSAVIAIKPSGINSPEASESSNNAPTPEASESSENVLIGTPENNSDPKPSTSSNILIGTPENNSDPKPSTSSNILIGTPENNSDPKSTTSSNILIGTPKNNSDPKSSEKSPESSDKPLSSESANSSSVAEIKTLYQIVISVEYKDGPIEHINNLKLASKFIDLDINGTKFNFKIYSIGNLWSLLNQWEDRNAVKRYVGTKESNRTERFGKSVNYLKKITHRLRDCTELSVAYQIKHKEVEEMLLSIRRLYSLIIFLRDQIEKNQKNYDTLERLILEIVIAMNQDYHIPYDQLVVLKNVQEKIKSDGKDLEERFRTVSNQILDRLNRAGSLKEQSPDDIGSQFPMNLSGLIKDDAPMTSPEANKFQKYVIPNNPVLPSKDAPTWDLTKYYQSEYSPHDKAVRGTGVPFKGYIHPEQVEKDNVTESNDGYEKIQFGEYSPVAAIPDNAKPTGNTDFVRTELQKRENESSNLISHLKNKTIDSYKNDTRKINYRGQDMSQQMYDSIMVKEANSDANNQLSQGTIPFNQNTTDRTPSNTINNITRNYDLQANNQPNPISNTASLPLNPVSNNSVNSMNNVANLNSQELKPTMVGGGNIPLSMSGGSKILNLENNNYLTNEILTKKVKRKKRKNRKRKKKSLKSLKRNKRRYNY